MCIWLFSRARPGFPASPRDKTHESLWSIVGAGRCQGSYALKLCRDLQFTFSSMRVWERNSISETCPQNNNTPTGNVYKVFLTFQKYFILLVSSSGCVLSDPGWILELVCFSCSIGHRLVPRGAGELWASGSSISEGRRPEPQTWSLSRSLRQLCDLGYIT